MTSWCGLFLLQAFVVAVALAQSQYTTCASCTTNNWCAETNACQANEGSCWHGTVNPENCIEETCHHCVDDHDDYWCYDDGVGYCSGNYHSGQTCFSDYNWERCECDAKTSCESCTSAGCVWCTDGDKAPACRGSWSGANPACDLTAQGSGSC